MIPAFDIALFRSQYPMYSAIPDAVLTNLWTAADAFGTPIITSLVPGKQSYFYYLVEAHLAELWSRGPGANGVVTEGKQGTVDAMFEVDKSNYALWWNQTSWGAQIALLMKMRGGFTPIFGCGGQGGLFNYGW
jgi:hypothetical protein